MTECPRGYERLPIQKIMVGDVLYGSNAGNWQIERIIGYSFDCVFMGDIDKVPNSRNLKSHETFNYNENSVLVVKSPALHTISLPDEDDILQAKLNLKELSDDRNRNWPDQQVQYFSSRWLCTR